jgi:hypothetical protein
MIVITYATHIDGYLPILIEESKKLGLKLEIIGLNKKWEGFFQRTLDYYEFLKNINQDEICIFIDGFDTIPLENEETILNKYYSFNKPIVWSVDLSRNLLGKIFFNSDDILINGGCYMGKCKEIIKIFEKLISTYGTNKKLDDQKMINDFYKNNKNYFNNTIALDMNSIIFANANYKKFIYYMFDKKTISGINNLTKDLMFDDENNILDYKFDDKTSKVISEKGISPCFISGPGCIDMDPIIKKLGYNLVNTRKTKYWDNFVIYQNFKEDFILYLIIVIFLIIIFIKYLKKK